MADSTPVSGDLSRATPEVQKYRPRACQSCARSKMRCVWPSEPGATPCQRCTKIKAPCTLPEINPRRRRGPSTRVGQLEEKIDGIMSLLNASQQIQQNSPSSSGQTPPPPPTMAVPVPVPLIHPEQSRNSIQQLLNPNVESTTTSGPPEGILSSSSSPLHANHFHCHDRLMPPEGLAAPGPSMAAGVNHHHHHHHQTTSTVQESVDIFRGFRVTFLEADRALNLYRSIYSSYFPFVTIPAMTSPYDLYEKAPFLFRTIVAVTMPPQGPTMQAEFKRWFREYVAQHVVVNNEARLDVLQAILVHLAWGDYHFMAHTEATHLIQLAMGLVVNLGLNRWPSDFGKAPKGAWMKKKHSLEEMRAVLGTFYVTSLCSTLFRQHHPMNHNSYLSQCCQSLQQVQEYDSDRFLVALVRMQQILNRGADLVPDVGDDDDNNGNNLSTPRAHYTPVHMALGSLQSEMEALVREQPADVECQALLWTHFHASVCRLYEPVALLRGLSNYDPSEATARTSALWQCLHSAREFFSAFLSIPPQNLICVPFQSTHLSFCLVTMVQLLFLVGNNDNSDWDPALARQAVDFETICLRVGDLFDEADKISASLGKRARYIHAGEQQQERNTTMTTTRSVMGIHRDKVRWIRNWYMARAGATFTTEQGERERETTTQRGDNVMKDGGGDTQPMDVDEGVQPAQYELDDGFWQAMFDWG